jgi:hypothetical protein
MEYAVCCIVLMDGVLVHIPFLSRPFVLDV